ncbi:unnamed protein product [Rotaria sp. Silwood1]|nr:unnamed protein product [Rotaria sp. Silwood1]CAF3745542.1 unnamed protein product [Rotaria sp. Silwood1]
MTHRWTIFISIAIAILTFGIGIIIGYFAISNNIKSSKDLTSQPHLAGLAEDLESAEVIEKRWLNDGFEVTKPRYNVLLSYPDENNPNRVTLKNGNTVIFQTAGVEAIYDSTQPKTVNPFLAYTLNGTVTSSKLFYANFGTVKDIQVLTNLVGTAELRGSIIIIRYGRIFRADKIMNAQHAGAVGVILYNDPADYAPLGTTPDKTYNQTWYMPESGTQRGTAYAADGDPLTPGYPSTDYMYRVREENIKVLPTVQAQPIGYEEARRILQYLSGPETPKEWHGKLANITYRYGGILNNGTRERRDTYDVIGIVKGEIEPDRYVVIGNHRDAWSLGAFDPTSGTAIMLEMSRVFGEMHKNGFRPRRSLMFCSWGAEEYGAIGSFEYVQEYVKVLGARVVSYINLDVAVSGNYTVEAAASPILFDVIIEAAKLVPSAYDPPGYTVYDKWMSVNRNNATNEPIIELGLGSGSDFVGFSQLAGSSNCHLDYNFNPNDYAGIEDYPLYHTSYEVFSAMKTFVDPTFAAHRTLAQLTGVLAMILSESLILPFNVTRYTIGLQQALDSLNLSGEVIDPLRAAIDEFRVVADQFATRVHSIDFNKHIVYAPATNDMYEAAGFPTISDAIVTGDQIIIEQQVAIATYFTRGAVSVLKDFGKFIF